MDVVANYPEWRKLVLPDRVILRRNLRYMDWEQIESLNRLQVVLAEDHGTVLIIE